MPRGRLITFEGGEGAGKSTQIARLAAGLRAAGRSVLETREPGGTSGAEEIRRLLVTGDAGRWDAATELLLICAARRDHVRRLIAPALAAGTWVVCDRFADSTLAYQGIAGGLGAETVASVNAVATGGLVPDLTLVLDVDPAVGLARSHRGGGAETRFETFDAAFHAAVRQAFLDIAQAEPQRCVVVDAAQPVDVVAAVIAATVRHHLALP
ncbi:MAG: dTMP kinase [Rhodospirillaceae bacterium]|nr:dTMP kinase [Rhodospirillaceae bacterium]